MGRTQAILLTWTTYGTWLRGDVRGWVDEGRVLPPDPCIEAADRAPMKHTPFTFQPDQLLGTGQAIGDSLRSRMSLRIFALTVQIWHVHVVIGATSKPLPDIVKCAKDAARWQLRLPRPLWTEKYDKRFCFVDDATHDLINYVEQHNLRIGWDATPWNFIESITTRIPCIPGV